MLALKPGLFPLPRLRCLLFLQAAFHRGFNSLQTLPNGFFTWGLRARSGFQKFHAFPPTLNTKKGEFLFPHFPLSPWCTGWAEGWIPVCGIGGYPGGECTWMWGQVTRRSPAHHLPRRGALSQGTAPPSCPEHCSHPGEGSAHPAPEPAWVCAAIQWQCRALEGPDPLLPRH